MDEVAHHAKMATIAFLTKQMVNVKLVSVILVEHLATHATK